MNVKKLGIATLSVWVTACGSGGVGPEGGPVSPPPPPPAQCTESVAFQGAGPLPARTVLAQSFSTSTAGRLDVTVDWTVALDTIGVYVVPAGNCTTIGEFNARSCNFIIRSENGPKPRKVSADNLAAGGYSLLVANFSNNSESVAANLVLKSESCPALSGTPAIQGASSMSVLGSLD